MRKSTKNRTKKNRFSRKNKKTQNGGMNEDGSGYVLVGIFKDGNRFPIEIPIFLEQNKNGELDVKRIIPYGKRHDIRIILPQLYKTKYRNLNLFEFDMDLSAKGAFIDNEHNTIINVPTMEQRRDEVEKKRYIDENKDKIRQIELTYPGLFQRIIVTEDEEKDALKELERKTNSYLSQNLLPLEKNEISSESIHPEEIEFMDFTNRITPFLREDLKKKRKNKISRKKIEDTNVTIGNVGNY